MTPASTTTALEPRLIIDPVTGEHIDGRDVEAVQRLISRLGRMERRIEWAKDAAWACLWAVDRRV